MGEMTKCRPKKMADSTKEIGHEVYSSPARINLGILFLRGSYRFQHFGMCYLQIYDIRLEKVTKAESDY